MINIMTLATGEWRYWLRSQLALGGTVIFALLLITTSVLTVLRMEAEAHKRSHNQAEAEETFLSQPDRHPHRMVHYGHYVFRAPAPLAIFDPGLDAVTGQSIFLEGHRQNSAMFARSDASTDLGSLSWLTPALIYQVFGPLLIILFGHGAVIREREAAVLAPLLALNTKGQVLVLGKGLALLSLVLVLLLPLLFTSAAALLGGESFLVVASLFGVYFCYLMMWALLTLLASLVLRNRSSVLVVLSALWISLTLVLPSVAVNIVSMNNPLAGKIETDLTMLADLRKLGDGHNANDPAFRSLRAKLIKQYGVDRVEDLPVNFRGVVAMNSEKKLTAILNKYASKRMAEELLQTRMLDSFGWVTPTLAVASASRSLSGTDLEHYHRFQREAEDLRFQFVQGLNKAHAEKLSYDDDVNRNKNKESGLKARVDASNWQVLDSFQFEPASALQRLNNSSQSIIILLFWCVVLLGGLVWFSRRIKL